MSLKKIYSISCALLTLLTTHLQIIAHNGSQRRINPAVIATGASHTSVFNTNLQQTRSGSTVNPSQVNQEDYYLPTNQDPVTTNDLPLSAQKVGYILPIIGAFTLVTSVHFNLNYRFIALGISCVIIGFGVQTMELVLNCLRQQT